MTASEDWQFNYAAWTKVRGELFTSPDAWRPLEAMFWDAAPISHAFNLSYQNRQTVNWSFTVRPKSGGDLRPYAAVSLNDQVRSVSNLLRTSLFFELDKKMSFHSIGNRLYRHNTLISSDYDQKTDVYWLNSQQSLDFPKLYRNFSQTYPRFRRLVKSTLLKMLNKPDLSQNLEENQHELESSAAQYSSSRLFWEPIDERAPGEAVVYALSLDLKRFYPSFSQDFVNAFLRRRISAVGDNSYEFYSEPDNRKLDCYKELKRISSSHTDLRDLEDSGDKLEDCEKGGIPSGVLSSGVISNVIFDAYVDKQIHGRMHELGYVDGQKKGYAFFRYVDDMVLIGSSVSALLALVHELISCLDGLNREMWQNAGMDRRGIYVNTDKLAISNYLDLIKLAAILDESHRRLTFEQISRVIIRERPELAYILDEVRTLSVGLHNMGSFVTTMTNRISQIAQDDILLLDSSERKEKFEELITLFEADISEVDVKTSTRKTFLANRIVKLLGVDELEDNFRQLVADANRRRVALERELGDIKGKKHGKGVQQENIIGRINGIDREIQRLREAGKKAKSSKVRRAKSAILRAIYESPDNTRLYYPLLNLIFFYPDESEPGFTFTPMMKAISGNAASSPLFYILRNDLRKRAAQKLQGVVCGEQIIESKVENLKQKWPYFQGVLKKCLYVTLINVVERFANHVRLQADESAASYYLDYFSRCTEEVTIQKSLDLSEKSWADILHVEEKQALACLTAAVSFVRSANNLLPVSYVSGRYMESLGTQWPYAEDQREQESIARLLELSSLLPASDELRSGDCVYLCWLHRFQSHRAVGKNSLEWRVLDWFLRKQDPITDEVAREALVSLLTRIIPPIFAHIRTSSARRLGELLKQKFVEEYGHPWRASSSITTSANEVISALAKKWARETFIYDGQATAPIPVGALLPRLQASPFFIRVLLLKKIFGFLAERRPILHEAGIDPSHVNIWNFGISFRNGFDHRNDKEILEYQINGASITFNDTSGISAIEIDCLPIAGKVDLKEGPVLERRIVSEEPGPYFIEPGVLALAKLVVSMLTAEPISRSRLDSGVLGIDKFYDVRALLSRHGILHAEIAALIGNIMSPERFALQRSDNAIVLSAFRNQFRRPITTWAGFISESMVVFNDLVHKLMEPHTAQIQAFPAIGARAPISDVRVTIAQISVDPFSQIDGYLNRGFLSYPFQQQREAEIQIENALAKSKEDLSNIILIPEFHIPNRLIYHLTKWVSRNGIAVIGGTEYVYAKRPIGYAKYIFNRAIAIFPEWYGPQRRGINHWRRSAYHYVFKCDAAPAEESKLQSIGHSLVPWNTFSVLSDPWLGKFGFAICYDFLNPALISEFHRQKTQHIVVLSFNKDFESFQHQAHVASTTAYCHVLYVNSGMFGGSTALTPYREHFRRPVFRGEGLEQRFAHTISMDMVGLRIAQAGNPAAAPHKFKEQPPGYKRQPNYKIRRTFVQF